MELWVPFLPLPGITMKVSKEEGTKIQSSAKARASQGWTSDLVIKCLLHKPENLSSAPHNPPKECDSVICNLNAEKETTRSLKAASLAQTVNLFQGRRETMPPKLKCNTQRYPTPTYVLQLHPNMQISL